MRSIFSHFVVKSEAKQVIATARDGLTLDNGRDWLLTVGYRHVLWVDADIRSRFSEICWVVEELQVSSPKVNKKEASEKERRGKMFNQGAFVREFRFTSFAQIGLRESSYTLHKSMAECFGSFYDNCWKPSSCRQVQNKNSSNEINVWPRMPELRPLTSYRTKSDGVNVSDRPGHFGEREFTERKWVRTVRQK